MSDVAAPAPVISVLTTIVLLGRRAAPSAARAAGCYYRVPDTALAAAGVTRRRARQQSPLDFVQERPPGMTPGDDDRERRPGTTTRDDDRERRRTPMSRTLQDLRSAARGLGRQPGVFAVRPLTLARGHGGNSASP